jgi:hypothetical protein
MHDESQTREEWTAGFFLLVAAELRRGARNGALTPAEANQLTGRFLVLLEQALDLPSDRLGAAIRHPWGRSAS